jgi:uracil-DNA glycosylase
MYLNAIDSSWSAFFEHEMQQPYFLSLSQALEKAYEKGGVYPPQHLIYEAFRLVALPDVRVVILGQDPYHGYGEAHGLSFSVPRGMRIPPSLRNIFLELKRDPNIEPAFEVPAHGDLTHWAQQGVLLLNATLTVEAGNPNAHRHLGWQTFTDRVIQHLSGQVKPKVFLLWGAFAQSKIPLIDAARHAVFTAPHPSPFSAHKGFIGCGHFSETNRLLVARGERPILWQIPFF